MQRRIRKNHIQDQRDARHDLLTALKVAMRKMIEETVSLTNLNMKSFHKERNEKMRLKRQRLERKFKRELKRQHAVRARNVSKATIDVSESILPHKFSRPGSTGIEPGIHTGSKFLAELDSRNTSECLQMTTKSVSAKNSIGPFENNESISSSNFDTEEYSLTTINNQRRLQSQLEIRSSNQDSDCSLVKN